MKKKMLNIGLNRNNKYGKFYINDFINDFEDDIKGKIFETDEEAEHFYINEYGNEKNKSPLYGFKLSNSLRRICPRKLTEKQKIKLFLLLKETNCKADIYMSYQDILEMKKGANE